MRAGAAPLPRPDIPLRIALVGAGNRASGTYAPLLPDLTDWVEVVACCDPVAGHRQALASALGARPYADVRELVRLAEAALGRCPRPTPSTCRAAVTETSQPGGRADPIADDHGVVDGWPRTSSDSSATASPRG